MSGPGPDLDSLIGGRVPRRERDRLAGVHEALLRAGPLPALPASLLQPPEVSVRLLPVAAPRARAVDRCWLP